MSKRLKIGTRVKTEDGEGTIFDYDNIQSNYWLYQIKLDNNKFSFSPVCYFPHEVTEIETTQKKASE